MKIDTTHTSKQHPSAELPRVLIVGAGFGGLQAAKALRKVPVQVMVIDRVNHHLFQPMLYEVATAGLSMEDISAPIRGILSRQQNTSVILAEVTGIDVEGQHVLTADQAIPYDYLIIGQGLLATTLVMTSGGYCPPL
jgi:NADH dehydrogenase